MPLPWSYCCGYGSGTGLKNGVKQKLFAHSISMWKKKTVTNCFRHSPLSKSTLHKQKIRSKNTCMCLFSTADTKMCWKARLTTRASKCRMPFQSPMLLISWQSLSDTRIIDNYIMWIGTGKRVCKPWFMSVAIPPHPGTHRRQRKKMVPRTVIKLGQASRPPDTILVCTN